MDLQSRQLGAGHILCLADAFDDILRQLSPDYFARSYQSVMSVFQELHLTTRLSIGWMHPGYACVAPGTDVPSLDEPGGLFGWVTRSAELDAYGNPDQMTKIAGCCARQDPPVQWATCSARLYKLAGEPASGAEVHRLFVAFAVADPAEWSGPSVIPNRLPPREPWRRLVLAAATRDEELEQQAWRDARSVYTPSALRLLENGLTNTRRCINW